MDRYLNEQTTLKNIDSTPYLAFSLFDSYPELRCGFSTRLGGVSNGIFSSMNLGFARGDNEENVLENYRRICESIGIKEQDLVFTDQVHDVVVRVAKKDDLGKGFCKKRDYAGVDAHITNEPGVPLLVFGADCVPLFFYDPVKRVIGVAHAGWKGTVKKIAAVCVQRMGEEYGCLPEDIRVVIGPSIGPDCYEVGEDVASAFRTAFSGDEFLCARPEAEGKYLLDLWQANRAVLCSAGVATEHISISELCTMCHQDLFFSHRATKGARGSMAGFLMLADEEPPKEKDQFLVQTIPLDQIKNNDITVQVPGSKSMTNRALLLATLAEGTSTLSGVLFSEDSRAFLQCVKDLGYPVTVEEEKRVITIKGDRSKVPKKEASIYVGSAGTAARFLTAFLGISEGNYTLDASAQMRKRPMAPLLHSLSELGTEIVFQGEEDHFPFCLSSTGVVKQEISINIDDSSQFLSALLIACCRTAKDFTIHVKGTHGMAYIDMTTKMMGEFGVQAIRQTEEDGIRFVVPGGQSYQAKDYQIEPDVSAACYFYAMAMLLGIKVTVAGVKKDTLQGDLRLLDVFCEAGATISETEAGIALTGPAGGTFHGVTVDMNSFSDQAITLAAIAPFADSPTTITGISHIRYQESNRIEAIVTELTKLGVRCEEQSDGVRIYPGKVHGGVVHTYEDHRIAMGFSLIGLRVPGIVIDQPMCCKKTFETYFDVLGQTQKQILEDNTLCGLYYH